MFTAGWYDDLKDCMIIIEQSHVLNCSMFCIFDLKGHFWVLSSKATAIVVIFVRI